ncbi:diphosphoinositol polyphosphate phosphohydrolase 1-like [Homalodisca vitripennis]|uniref:diphosphoinositol polyphosphate phosphohydrolase 1-like n=1 Tax=Homalodisca vitripennis TaxID=197043 RepID=UPI001EEB2302|nr:diphosphoinositol polyphosphate phosphohydrolase 1-like [Homalodisca vitripennis]
MSGRQRKWFTLEEALKQLSLHKPMQMTYFESLRTSVSRNSSPLPPFSTPCLDVATRLCTLSNNY